MGPGTTETPDGQGGTPAAPPRVTRRRVLVAGAATVATVGVAAGGWAAVENVPSLRRRLHAAGLLDGADRAVPDVGDIPAVDYGALAGADGRRYRWGRWAPAGGEGTWRSFLPAQISWIGSAR